MGEVEYIYDERGRVRHPRSNPIKYVINSSNCWLCVSHKKFNDFGHLRIKSDYRTWALHRWVYTLEFGEIDVGMIVRHKCDNPNCINPDHLEIGTHADNVRDKIIRGRDLRGDNHPQSKLTEKCVRLIRVELANGKSLSQLADRFDVSFQLISKIKRGKIWGWLE